MATILGAGRSYSTGSEWYEQTPLAGVVVGTVVDIDDAGVPVVDFTDNEHGALRARSLVHITPAAVGKGVALLFERNDPAKPIIVGVLQVPSSPVDVDQPLLADRSAGGSTPVDATVDGERVTFTARTEIVLRCGKASIVLTRAGRILIRGTYLLSDSSSVNRIRGGAVQIN